MHTAYLVITVLFALIASYSGLGKIQRDPHQVRVVHETIGVPFKYFPLLAACEFAGAVGLVRGDLAAASRNRGGNRSRPLLRGSGSVPIYVSAMSKAWGPAAFMLLLAGGDARFSRLDDLSRQLPRQHTAARRPCLWP